MSKSLSSAPCSQDQGVSRMGESLPERVVDAMEVSVECMGHSIQTQECIGCAHLSHQRRHLVCQGYHFFLEWHGDTYSLG